jgi:sporulation protein YlmC with PRC-barrel domain
MPELSDFRLGADVVDKDGHKAGSLAGVLVDQDGFEPQAVVVRDETSLLGRLVADEKLLVTDEVVIPFSAVESATHDQVRLSLSAADVRLQKPYLSYRLRQDSPEGAVLREAELLGGGLGVPNLEEVADKPESLIEIDRDENVMIGRTGRRLGHVQDLLFDGGELAGVVVRPEGFFKQNVVLPIRFLSRSDDLALFANVSESDVEGLKPFVEPEP